MEGVRHIYDCRPRRNVVLVAFRLDILPFYAAPSSRSSTFILRRVETNPEIRAISPVQNGRPCQIFPSREASNLGRGMAICRRQPRCDILWLALHSDAKLISP